MFFTPVSGGLGSRLKQWSVGTTDATRGGGVDLTDPTAPKDLLSGAPIPFCAPEIVDCMGHPGGQARYDGCGVCGGDNCGMNAAGTECINPPVCASVDAAGTCVLAANARLDCATDATGNSSPCGSSVTVQDTVAPILSGVPGPITVTQTAPGGTPVAVPLPTASDTCEGAVAVTSNAPALFPLGTTTAIGAALSTASCPARSPR